MVLVALIGAIGYGGWSVLQEVQRVQLAPVDQAPAVVAEIDPLAGVQPVAPIVAQAPAAEAAPVTDTALAEVETSARPDLMDRLYRPQALDVPVLTSRDGPIASIDPRQTGALATPAATDIASAVDNALSEALDAGVQVVADAAPQLEVLAVRPSWVRVQSADGTVLFEKILDAGERYVVPQLEEPPVLRAGNSGSVYFAVNGKTYGPAAPGASVVKNVALSADSLSQTFAEADLSEDADLAKFVNVAQATPVVEPTQAVD